MTSRKYKIYILSPLSPLHFFLYYNVVTAKIKQKKAIQNFLIFNFSVEIKNKNFFLKKKKSVILYLIRHTHTHIKLLITQVIYKKFCC
jgi:hypothetical protein